jgi:homospermidine synthase
MTYPNHGRIDGPIVIIGFGSIGRGTLPLIERHFEYDARKVVVIDPALKDHTFLTQRGIRHIELALTRDNYREVLGGVFEEGRGFCVNLSVDTSSLDLMKFCREIGVLYIDTVVEPWAGFYFETTDNAQRTNYALRQAVRDEKARQPRRHDGGLLLRREPGMVSWFVKEALMRLARDTGSGAAMPNDREGWARLMQALGVKGIHIAERDTQKSARPKPHRLLRQHLVGRGFRGRGFSAGRARLGHARTLVPRGRAPPRDRVEGGDLDRAARRHHPRPHLVPDAGAAIRLSSSPTTRRSRSPTTTPWAKATRRNTGRPATTPTTPATTPCCRCTRRSARGRSRKRTTSSTRTRSSKARTNWAC